MNGISSDVIFLNLNPIPTGHGRNQPIYERHVTTAGRNRVKKDKNFTWRGLMLNQENYNVHAAHETGHVEWGQTRLEVNKE